MGQQDNVTQMKLRFVFNNIKSEVKSMPNWKQGGVQQKSTKEYTHTQKKMAPIVHIFMRP